jgi:hypothetical protein
MSESTRRLCVAACLPVVLFLCIAGLYLIRTPAWDNNDEKDHVLYIEHIVATGKPPAIAVANGIESHQPPLYYAIVATWQRVIGVPVITPKLGQPNLAAGDTGGWQVSHVYDAAQRQDAIDLRILRVPSVIFGALTVLAAFLATQLMFGRRDLSVAVAVLVAVWPKFDVVSAAVTNDVLADALCAWLLVLVLVWLRRPDGRTGALLGAGIGAVAACAALTKYTTLPVVGLLGGYFLVRCVLRQRWAPALLACAVGIVLSGWWFAIEWVKYGDPLAATASTTYLRAALPALLWPTPTLDPRILLGYTFQQLLDSVWWDGDWNELLLPHGLNIAICIVGAGSVALSFGRRRAIGRTFGAGTAGRFWFLVLGLVAALVSLVLVMRETTQAEGRYLFVGIVPLSILLVVGVRSLFGGHARLTIAATWVWPLLLAGINAYVVGYYLLARGGL